SLGAAVLVGGGVMAAVDEIVFHQLLQWHHFFDQSTPMIGIFSDGMLHAAELIILVAGFFWIARLARRQALIPSWTRAGLLLGMGGFQLFDGIVDHKLLRLHQVRYGVELLPHALAGSLRGLVLLLIGAWLWRRPAAAARHGRPGADAGRGRADGLSGWPATAVAARSSLELLASAGPSGRDEHGAVCHIAAGDAPRPSGPARAHAPAPAAGHVRAPVAGAGRPRFAAVAYLAHCGSTRPGCCSAQRPAATAGPSAHRTAA